MASSLTRRVLWPSTLTLSEPSLARRRNVLDNIEEAAGQTGTPNPKLYILHPKDTESLDWLRRAYPDGRTEEYRSSVHKDKNFIMFFTSPDASSASLPASESARR